MSDDALKRDADRLAPELVAWRRDLHRHPELGFEERRTAGFVEARLKAIGLDTKVGIAQTGVVGVVRAASAVGPPVLLRADMDALPLQEVDGREYGSCTPGKMHACGHDGHTAMLLGAATLLAGRRNDLRRDVLLCFQPSEERDGGAERMIEEGVLDELEPGSAYALHLWSLFPVGTVHLRPGASMAAQDEFTVRITGLGGHGAMPQNCRDPIAAASQAVSALQLLVSREVDPIEPAVVTVGSIHGGTAPNIIPDDVVLSGTLRSFDEGVRQLLRRRVPEVFEGVSRVLGCSAEFELRPGYPAVINNPEAVTAARRVAVEVVGEVNVHEHAPMACAEDFSYFLNRIPGAFIFLGAGNESRGITAPHHSPEFDIDEAVLPRGAELLARLALDAG